MLGLVCVSKDYKIQGHVNVVARFYPQCSLVIPDCAKCKIELQDILITTGHN